jgi:phosphatidylserine decarboxylase
MEAPPPPPWRDKIATLPQYLIPQHLLSRTMHRLARLPAGRIKDTIVRRFIDHFGIDMAEAQEPDPGAYPTFNAFFTRSLRPGARPICTDIDAIASPVDGAVSQLGKIDQDRIFQAKGHDFGLTTLLGGEPSDSAPFDGGSFATLYLSPRDYHRIHIPIDAVLRRMIYVPGRLFAVKPSTVRSVPGLFARNERVVCIFDTGNGPMALALVGAIFVGSIETVWSGELTPARSRLRRCWDYQDQPPEFTRGDEVGRFNMGSTVILLFGPNGIHWDEQLKPGNRVRMGECIAHRAGRQA